MKQSTRYLRNTKLLRHLRLLSPLVVYKCALRDFVTKPLNYCENKKDARPDGERPRIGLYVYLILAMSKNISSDILLICFASCCIKLIAVNIGCDRCHNCDCVAVIFVRRFSRKAYADTVGFVVG